MIHLSDKMPDAFFSLGYILVVIDANFLRRVAFGLIIEKAPVETEGIANLSYVLFLRVATIRI